MEKKEMGAFSIAALLLVTGFCFLSFDVVLRILDGVNMKLFLMIGTIIFISGLLSVVYISISQRTERRKTN